LIREIKPHVVLTFDPFGGYGHPDHIAISQFSMAAVLEANAPSKTDDNPPWTVSKLYFRAFPPEVMGAYESAFKQMTFNVDGKIRKATPWPNWSITTKIDTSNHWEQVWKAVNCHQTQISIYNKLKDLSEENHQNLWGKQSFYRVFSMVNGGRGLETDIFEGLR
jgi:LmbE family N-acetylglucosaminyl deacetylase